MMPTTSLGSTLKETDSLLSPYRTTGTLPFLRSCRFGPLPKLERGSAFITTDAIGFQAWPAELVQDAYFLDGEAGYDRAEIRGNSQNNRFTVTTSPDGLLLVLEAPHTVTLSNSTERLDVLGGPGRDTLRAVGLERAPLVEINLKGQAAGDTIDASAAGIHSAALSLRGGDGNDRITGSDAAETLDGGPGDDSLVARGGNDVVRGGDGNDRLLGGSGSDLLLGGDGDDTLRGQAGDDTIATGDGQDTVVDQTALIDEQFTFLPDWIDA